MKEYLIEEGGLVNKGGLRSGPLSPAAYEAAHKGLVIPCHDAILEVDGGALLVKRKGLPARGILWPLGGRLQRGISADDSIRWKVKDESGLDICGLTELGYARSYFNTDPFGHGRGTDTLNIMYFGRAVGELKLNEDHFDPTTVKPKDYTPEFRKKLHPYVQDFMDEVMPRIVA